jgi:hypothetical protein
VSKSESRDSNQSVTHYGKQYLGNTESRFIGASRRPATVYFKERSRIDAKPAYESVLQICQSREDMFETVATDEIWRLAIVSLVLRHMLEQIN